ncbi:hypothetical protein ACIPSE_47045 [Streptomyces sp. NPDC090106]|uniref:hypothetical protein n=1 Tax=Streptomyces sp. NPDC090106 TaxID=3365946 RepID=UPI0037FFF27E
MVHSRKAALAAVFLVASFGLAACGGETGAGAGDSSEKSGHKNTESKNTESADLQARSGERRVVTEQEIPLPEFEDNPDPQGEARVEICTHTVFKGHCRSLPVFVDELAAHDRNTSSIRNPNNFSVTFYGDPDFSGASVTLKPGAETAYLSPPVVPVDLNDRVASWQPQVEGRAAERAVVTVCTEPELRGECKDLPVVRGSIDALNDKISSIQKLSDLDLIFYTETDFKGAAIKMPSRTYLPNLNPDGPNNGIDDKISSWQPLLSDNGVQNPAN